MENYKIKVATEAESKEAQELFEQLGFRNCHTERFGMVCVLNGNIETDLIQHWDFYTNIGCKEITLQQLRDLVFLHRNDAVDATHTNEWGKIGFLCSDGTEYFWDYTNGKWFKPQYMTFENKNMKLISKKQEQGLISGADALRALADGEEVQIESNKQWVSVDNCQVYQFLSRGCSYKFRLKPRTITLNGIEIPCCGTNYKQGQLIWILNSLEPTEYCSIILDESDELPSYWWSTEEKIKQVVAALRSVFK